MALCAVFPALGAPGVASGSDLSVGIAERLSGNVSRSIDLLESLRRRTAEPVLKARATSELGASLLRGRRLDEADEALREASATLAGADLARNEIDRGNLAALLNRRDEARAHYERAIAVALGDAALVLPAELNLARLDYAVGGGARLGALARRIEQLPDSDARARLQLNLGQQALELREPSVELAYRSLDSARAFAAKAGEARLEAQALDGLAQLYENYGRAREALALNALALERARAVPDGNAADVLAALEWREGRLAAKADDTDRALAAYQRAVNYVESVRQDIPIEYDDGRSSFRATLEPIYLGYADALLRRAAGLPPAERASVLYRVRDAIELVRQAELQDYLRDRCEVDAIQHGPRTGMGKGTAVLYPIAFADRLELLLETDAGISWRTTKVASQVLRLTALTFANDMRRAAGGYLPNAQALYRWLFAPFEEVYREEKIDTLIVVPEGSLRLVALGALHDGDRFAIERFAIGTVTGFSMTNTEPQGGRTPAALVAGMSVPGAVVEKLSDATVDSILGTRGPGQVRSSRAIELRESLQLPAVKEEVDAVARITGGRKMLDEAFTLSGFQSATRSGDYRIVHIASHGFFGGNADTSYIMAFDDIITMGKLQALLQNERFRRNPIEILSLSACQTAEGDDRSPLGISGAAVKARAKSVLGTLWPVEDNSARFVMESFYGGLTRDHMSKARALQRAQVELLRKRETSHPFFWAPYVLIGNWL